MNGSASGGVRPVLWALINRLVTVIWVLALTLLILAALYVGLGRQVMVNLHHFETDIETALSEGLGRSVRIGNLTGRWQGLDPVVQVRHLAIGEKSNADASLDQLRIRLDTWASLMRQRVVFREFGAGGAEARLIQRDDGRFSLAGVWEPPDRSAEEALADIASNALEELDARAGQWVGHLGRILSDPVISLDDVRLRMEPASGEPFPLMVPSMDIRFEDGLFSASGRMLEGRSAQRIGAFALEGRHLFSGGLTGQLYLDLESGATFSDLLSPYAWRGLSVESLDARAKAWVGFRNGRPDRARARLGLPELGLESGDKSMPTIGDLSMDALWEREDEGWALQVRGSAFQWGNREASAFTATAERGAEGTEVAASGLDVGAISTLARRSELLPESVETRLAAHRPRGTLERLVLRRPTEEDWRLRSRFSNLSVAAVDGAPSGERLTGYLEASPRKGRVTLAPGPARIGFPELFHTDWRFERLAGRVRWSRRPDGWDVGSHRLLGRHEGMAVSGGFRLRLHEEGPDTLSLRVGVAGGHTGRLGRYVPKYAVPRDLYTFLDESVGEGKLTRGWYYGHGELDEEDGAFTSSMHYRFRDTALAYHPDWPELVGASGSVRVQDAEGDIRLDKGSVAGVELEPSQARVLPDDGEIRVDVDTGARREGDLLTTQWREESPVADIAGNWVRDLRVNGSSRANLSLSLWPMSARDPEVDFRLALAGAGVRYAPGDVQWQQVSGPIRFRTGSGFSDTDLEGRFMEEPVTLQVRDGPEQAPVFRQRGALSVAKLEQWLDRPVPRASGSMDYEAAFRPTEGPSLNLDADLDDLVLDWPAPLAKEGGEGHRLETRFNFGDPNLIEVDGHWDPLGAFRFALRDGAMERGRVGLGESVVALPEAPVFSLEGELGEFPVDQWWRALSDMSPPQEVVPTDGGANLGSARLPPLRVSLRVGEPRFNGWSLGPAQVKASAEPAGDWRVNLASDWAQGIMSRQGGKPVSVDLEHLVLPGLEQDEAGDEPVPRLDDAAMTRGARDWPQADVRVDRLVLGKRRISDLSLMFAPDGRRVRVEPLAFNMEGLTVDGGLTWQPAEETGVTEFSGDLGGSDLRGLEAVLGKTTVPISSKRTEASLNLAWPGGPGDFSLSRLRAAMDFRLEDGSIDQDIEGARLFRVFGLLNTDTLWRRLQLDFSDVYESGITFDHIEGNALIHEGRLIFDPAIDIQAPSGGFRMSGEADLISESLDMRLVVVLPITQNLPLAAVLFGYAPPIGGALFVIDKVFGGVLSRVTSATYTVEGNWDDPSIELRNLFDTESDLDSYERPEVDVEAPERPAGEIRR